MDQSPEQRLAALEAAVAALSERLTALEQRPAPTPDPASGDLSLVQALQQRTGPEYEAGALRGAIIYAGALSIGQRHYIWQGERGAADLPDPNGETLAQVFGALASQPRLTLIGALLEGERSTQELQAVLGVSSTGLLHHHLKELQAANIVVQRGRGHYALAPQALVPVLVMLACSEDLRGAGS